MGRASIGGARISFYSFSLEGLECFGVASGRLLPDCRAHAPVSG